MIDGGAIAKDRFRYQDMCSVYFSLNNYLQYPTTFTHIYCEQDKLDFEIWHSESFTGYQVKNRRDISAKDVNSILKYYIVKAENSGKQKKNFCFIFAQNPKGSLGQVLLKLSGRAGVKTYDKRTAIYILNALNDLDVSQLNVDHCCHKPEDIERLVFGMANDVLKNELNTFDDIPSEKIKDFISRFRDEVDKISSETNPLNRVYPAKKLNELIKAFLGRGIIKTYYEKDGEEFTQEIIPNREKKESRNEPFKSLKVLGDR